jgi:hypothetical protein
MHDQARLSTVKAASVIPDEYFLHCGMMAGVKKMFGLR